MTDLAAIGRLIDRHSSGAYTRTAVPRLMLACARGGAEPIAVRRQPHLVLVADGSNWWSVRGEIVRQQPGSLFVTALELPVGGGRVDASFKAVVLGLDPLVLSATVADMPPTDCRAALDPRTVSLVAGARILDPIHRLLRLLDEPAAIGVLAPMIEREILFRLLGGPAGAVLRRVCRSDGRLQQVRTVAEWLRRHPFAAATVADLAAMASVSESTLHRHFRAMTGRTPLQFQKDLRLREARQRLVAGREAPKAVAAAVGYLSLSQFSREYRRHFGTRPRRDLEAGRGTIQLG